MDNRTIGIVATVVSALVCGCAALLSCIFGGLIATGTPFDTTVNGVAGVQTFPVWLGVTGLCLSVILILIPVVIGFLTLRKKPQPTAAVSEPIPPAS